MPGNVLLTPQQLYQMSESQRPVIIDTRSPETYGKGHIDIPGAVNIHDISTFLGMSSKEGIVELRDKFANVFGARRRAGCDL